MMKKTRTPNALLLTFCAVGVLTASTQSWAAGDITNCALVTGTTEADSDSQVDNTTQADILTLYANDPDGFDAASQDDESCIKIDVLSVFDYGDAPDTYGTSTSTPNAGGAAVHEIIPGLRLGAIVDDEADGVPGAEADGDELADAGSQPDEDGYNVAALTAGSPVTLSVGATNMTSNDAKLFCWIDYNGDGVFATDDSEVGSINVPAGTASNTQFDVMMPQVPATVMDDTGGTSYARCRLSTDATLDKTLPTGALVDGEVEDKKVTFTAAPVFDLALTKKLTDQSDPQAVVRAGDTVSFDIEVTNQGTMEATNIKVIDYIPAGFELNDANWTASADGTTATLNTPLHSDGTTLASNTSTTVTIMLKAKDDVGTGPKTNYAEIFEASDKDGTVTPDNDSMPDQMNGNETGTIDDMIDSADDEDDHDLAIVEVSPTVDVDLVKTVLQSDGVTTADSVRRGDTLFYVLTVTNSGPDDATNVMVTDELPTGLTYVGNDGSATFNNNKIEWTVPSLINGGTESLKIEMTVD